MVNIILHLYSSVMNYFWMERWLTQYGIYILKDKGQQALTGQRCPPLSQTAAEPQDLSLCLQDASLVAGTVMENQK